MNSLKSIYSRITSIDPAIDAMAEIGVHIKNSAGEMRDVDDILADLAEKWHTLSREQQQSLGLHIAGRFQLSRFLVLMENFDTATEATADALNSSGSAMKENERYLDSYEAKINIVKNAWTETTLAMQEDVLGDAILGATTVATGFINMLTTLVDKVGLLPAVFGTAGVAVSLFFKRLDLASLTSIHRGVLSIGSAFETLARSIFSANTALRVLNSLLYAGIFTAVGWGISKLIEKFTEARQRTEELQKANEQSTKSISGQREEIDELIDRYEALSKMNRNIEQEEEYVQLQNELAGLLPVIKLGEDEKGNAIIANASAIRDNVEILEKQLEIEQEIASAKAHKTITDNADSIADEKKELDELEKAYESASEAFKKASDELATARRTDEKSPSRRSANVLKDAEREFDKAEKAVEDARTKYSEHRSEVAELIGETHNAYIDILSVIEGLSNADVSWLSEIAMDDGVEATELERLAEQVIELREALGEGFSFEDINIEQLERLIEIVDDSEGVSKDNSDAWESFRDTLRNVGLDAEIVAEILGRLRLEERDVAKTAKEFGVDLSDVIPVYSATGDAVEGFSDNLDKLADSIDDSTESMEDQNEELDKILEKYNEATGNINELNGILNELDKGNGISAKTIGLIIDKYDELLPHINDEISLREAVGEAIEENAKTAEQAFLEKIHYSTEYYNTAIQNEGDLYRKLSEYYKGDLEEFKSLAKAKEEVEKTLLKNLNDAWSTHLGIAQQAMSMMSMSMGTAGLTSSVMGAMQAKRFQNTIDEIGRFREEIDSIVIEDSGIDFDAVGRSIRDTGRKLDDATKKNKKNEKSVRSSTYVADKYSEALEKLSLELEKQRSIKSKFPKYSKQHRDALREEIKLLEKQHGIYQSMHKDLEKQIKSGKIVSPGIHTTTTSVPTSSGSRTSSSYTGKYANEINRAANTYGVDPHLIAAIIRHESNFNPRAVSHAGARGLMQLMPGTARGLGVSNSFDPLQNIMGGTKYIAQQLKAFGGDIEKALAAYNAGPGNVRKYGGIPPFRETQNYVRNVTSTYRGASSGSPVTGSSVSQDDASRELAQRAADLDKAKLDLIGYEQNMLSTMDQIEELYFAIFESHLAQFDHAKDRLNRELSEIDYYQSRYDESSVEWMEQQIQREKVMKQQNKLHKDSIKFIEREIKSNKDLTRAQRMRLDDLLIERQVAMWELERDIMNERIKMSEVIIDTYKRSLEAQRDAALNSIDRLMDEIDEKEREREYERRLKEQQQSRQEILDEIAQWSIDDSDSAKKRIRELTEQLQDLDEEIDDIQHDKRIEDRKDALQKERDQINSNYDDLLNDEEAFAKMRSDIIVGNTNNIQRRLNSFYKDVDSMTESLGKSIVKNLKRSIDQINSYIGSSDFTGVKIPHFNTGGRARVRSSSGGLAVVHDKEIILNNRDSDIFLTAIESAKELIGNLRAPKLPNLPVLNSGVNSEASNVYDISLNIESLNGTKSDAKYLFNEMVRNIELKGGKF